MSKSKGNVVKPLDTMDLYGRDVLRYFLMREMTPGQDSSFSQSLIVERNNSELSNDLGNGLNRVTKLIEKHFEARLPARGEEGEPERALRKVAETAIEAVQKEIRDYHPNGAIREAMELSRAVNRYLEQRAPWKVIKEDQEAAGSSLAWAAEALRLVGLLLHPVMPERCSELLNRLGAGEPNSFAEEAVWGKLEAGVSIHSGTPLFPRFDLE